MGLRSRVVLVGMVLAALLVATQFAVAARPMRAVSRAAKSLAVSASRWSIIHSPNPSGGEAELDGVSCVSATDCIAVGGDLRNGSTVVEHWSGKKWSIIHSPRGVGSGGVSCVSASDCTAVGPPSQWNGTVWSITPSPTPSDGSLAGVSCVSAVDCIAVGRIGNDAGGSTGGDDAAGHTLVEQWNGTKWSIVHAPNPSVGGALMGVSCVTAVDCTAVGNSFGVSDGHTYNKSALVEHWNGTKWSITLSKGGIALDGVSCVSATDCTAVGRGGSGTLVEHWNGKKWSIIHSLTPSSGGGGLDGVSCVSATDCTAVGFSIRAPISGPQVSTTLVEHWNGKKWSVIPSSNPSGGGVLLGVSCVSATHCAAVGFRGSGPSTLVEQESR